MINYWIWARDGLLACLLIMVFLIAVLAVDLTPAADGPITIITNPLSGQNALDVVAATQGSILAAGRWKWIAVAQNAADPDFRVKLKAAGALLLLAPLTNACLKSFALQGT